MMAHGHTADPEREVDGLALLIARGHRAALADSSDGERVRIEHAHRAALVDTEAAVYGEPRSERLLALATWAIRETLAQSASLERDADRLATVVRVNLKLSGT